jgi:hypothetical protein
MIYNKYFCSLIEAMVLTQEDSRNDNDDDDDDDNDLQ